MTTMSEHSLLRGRFCIRFTPANSIKKFSIPLYRVIALNVGSVPGEQVLISRIRDGKNTLISFKDFGVDVLSREQCVSYLKRYNFKLVTQDLETLSFEKF